MTTFLPALHSITLQGFRSLASEKTTFDNPTFVVGRNGAGKSNLADAFAFLAEAMASPLLTVFDRRGGYRSVSSVSKGDTAAQSVDTLGVMVELRNLGVLDKSQATYGFVVQPRGEDGFKVVREVCRIENEDGSTTAFDRNEKEIASDHPGFEPMEIVEEQSGIELEPAVEHDALALPLIAGRHPFREVYDFLSGIRLYRIDPLALRDPQNPDEGRRLLTNGANVASVLKHLGRHSQEELPNIRDLLAAIVPGMVDVSPIAYGKKLSLEFTQQWSESGAVKFDASNMSDGTLRALGLITAVFQRPTPSVVIIEEPELTMHPGALGSILDLLEHASKRMQVVVTTHSPDILDARWIEDRHLRLLEWKEGETKIARVSDASRRLLDEGIMCAGELLRSNALRAEGSF